MKVLIIYGSLLGKTERIAKLIEEQLSSKNITTTVKSVINTEIQDLADHDIVILGCSTWDDGMLQYDFRKFNKDLQNMDFTNHKFSIFALGGHKYVHFCAAADILEETVKNVNGILIMNTLKLDIDHDESPDKKDKEVINWANELIGIINKS